MEERWWLQSPRADGFQPPHARWRVQFSATLPPNIGEPGVALERDGSRSYTLWGARHWLRGANRRGSGGGVRNHAHDKSWMKV